MTLLTRYPQKPVRLTDGGSQHRVLLGRELPRGVIMVYDGTRGTVTLVLVSQQRA